MSVILKEIPPQTVTTIRGSATFTSTTDSYDATTKLLVEVMSQALTSWSQILSDSISIGRVSYDEFELDLDKMIVDQKYVINYNGSKYGAIKNKKGELELYELDA